MVATAALQGLLGLCNLSGGPGPGLADGTVSRASGRNSERSVLPDKDLLSRATCNLCEKLWCDLPFRQACGMGLDIVDPARLGAVNVRQNLSQQADRGHLSEAVNALLANIPKVRSLLQPRWGFAFSSSSLFYRG